MSDCTNGGRRVYNAPTHTPAEDELRVTAHFKDGLHPQDFVANRDTPSGTRVLDYLESDGERFERVRECENKHRNFSMFVCSECGAVPLEGLVDVGGKLFGFAYCPNCGAKVKVGA